MNTIEVTLPQDADVERFALMLDKSKADALEILEQVAEAGARELLDYCMGEVVPTTFSEVRVNRVDYLRKAGITVRALEELAGHLLQVPSRAAATILQAAAARYAFEWENDVASLVKDTLQGVQPESDGSYLVSLPSALVIDAINRRVKQSGKPKIRAARELAGTYVIQKETYDFLLH